MLESEYFRIKTKILEDPKEIMAHIHKGISIPILPEFRKYIEKDINVYNAKAIVLEEDIDNDEFGALTDKITGFSLVYEDGSDILYFGFFNVLDHDEDKIELLVEAIIDYAKNNRFRKIRGPINVPTMIFGWGFMVEGSKKDLFIGSPINPPIYQKVFQKMGFYILFKEDRYSMPALKMDPHKDKKLISMGINNGDYKNDPFDTGDYEYYYYNPTREELMEIKDEFLELNARFMPPSAQITPRASNNYNNLVDFIHTYGARWMMWVVRHKKTNEMVANGYVIPNLFSRNKKGEFDSVSFHAWVVHEEHRRKYLAMIMYGFTSIQGKDRKTPHYITWGSWPVGADNEANAAAARKMGGKKDRSHLILQYDI